MINDPCRIISSRTSSIPIRFTATISGNRIERLRRRAFARARNHHEKQDSRDPKSRLSCCVCGGCFRARVISGR